MTLKFPLATLALIAAAALTSPALAASPTDAELETARALFREGRDLRARGELRAALEKFKAANTVGRTPITGIELARTHLSLGELVEAREAALGVSRLPVEADETARSQEARDEATRLANELRPRIPSVTIELSGAPSAPSAPTPSLTIDGAPFPQALLGEAYRLNPGSHVIVVKTARGTEARTEFRIAEGEKQTIALSIPKDPKAPEIPKEPTAPAGPTGLVVGAAFTVVPHVFLPASEDPASKKPFAGGFVGMSLELGHEISPTFEVLGRVKCALGDRAKPSYFLAGGPGFAIRINERLWVDATMLVGRAHSAFRSTLYNTDWVLGADIGLDYAVFTRAHGQYMVSVTAGYLFSNDRLDPPFFFFPISFGYRSF